VVLLLVLGGAAGADFVGVEAGAVDAAGVDGVMGFDVDAEVEDDGLLAIEGVFAAGVGAGLLAVLGGTPYQVFSPL
jgi:hypothetical protein